MCWCRRPSEIFAAISTSCGLSRYFRTAGSIVQASKLGGPFEDRRTRSWCVETTVRRLESGAPRLRQPLTRPDHSVTVNRAGAPCGAWIGSTAIGEATDVPALWRPGSCDSPVEGAVTSELVSKRLAAAFFYRLYKKRSQPSWHG